jgi:hypothetical protein
LAALALVDPHRHSTAMAVYNKALDDTVLNRFLDLDQGGKIQVSTAH